MMQNHNINGDNITIGGNLVLQQKTEYTSLLADIINKLSSATSCLIEGENVSNHEYKIFLPEEKLKYNNVQKYSDIFRIAKQYYAKINDLYKILDQEKPGTKARILEFIEHCYIHEKYKNLMSDDIIDNVLKRLQHIIINSQNNQQCIESVEHCLYIILLDAFMRCRILEKPIPDDNTI